MPSGKTSATRIDAEMLRWIDQHKGSGQIGLTAEQKAKVTAFVTTARQNGIAWRQICEYVTDKLGVRLSYGALNKYNQARV